MKFVLLGLVVGALSGILGLGGGIFLVPALIFLFGFSPHEAQGTSLAVLIPPIGLFAALEYYRKGYIDFSVVGFICLGFVFGAYAGAFFVDRISVPTMRRVFGFFMFFIAVQMVFTTAERRVGAAVPAALSTALLAVIYYAERRLGIAASRVRRHLERHKPKPPHIEYHI
ncbi:MAG TPA: sulfite exporter TauE/SafE family protein [Candidatus Binatia bacterium]|nr:sulfite exporter TauE/SafE family protein [Candidatus Binatia bacterium]